MESTTLKCPAQGHDKRNRDSPIVAVSPSNSYTLRPLVAPALFLHEPRDSDVCGRSMMPCGNPFWG